jgi:uncharacterized protein (TIGR02147 family)
MIDSDGFRQYLQSELVRRCQRNPRYSIRAFAKALGMDASTLAKILNGKRKLGQKAILAMSAKLDIQPSLMSEILGLNNKYQQLEQILFDVLSDWQYMAILELMTVDSFQADPRWISRALGISLSESKSYIQKLLDVGMLKIDESGKWHDTSSGKTTNIAPGLTSISLRQLQRSFLTQAIAALENVPLNQRDQTSMIMAIDVRLLPKARERVRQFRRDLAKFLSRSGERNDVYNLSISLFPLTQFERNFHD